ncbi:CDK5RAP1 family protein [Megaselia abdita]
MLLTQDWHSRAVMKSFFKIMISSKLILSFNKSLRLTRNLYHGIPTLNKIDFKDKVQKGPDLKDFLIVGKNFPKVSEQFSENIPYLDQRDYSGNQRKVFFEVYGCQMNVNDTEIVWSILKNNQYQKVEDAKDADVILIMTCSVREGAESKIWNRLKHLQPMKNKRGKKHGPLQIGVLGCMAERLKEKLLEKERWVDVVAGPDSYKDLPRLLTVTKATNQSMVNVLLSLDETYADVKPMRLNSDAVTAFVSIMRGCDNMCTYCIVPFTRGKERSRPLPSIEDEVRDLVKSGIKEITLLGQNVNSYRDTSDPSTRTSATNLVPGFNTVYKSKVGGIRFAELLERVALAAPHTRIRFTSPHPKDFPDEVIDVIKKHNNICKSLHMPAQSGSSTVLERMRRGYTRESYLELIKHIRSRVPEVSLSTDMICGFCGETDEEFADTMSLMEQVKYNVAYLFAYSMREKTTAHRRYQDDVPQEVKIERLKEMVRVFREGATEAQSKFKGSEQLILIEGKSKRSEEQLFGRNDANIKVIVPNVDVSIDDGKKSMKPGDFVKVKILNTNSQVLIGDPICHSNLDLFYSNKS